MVPRSVLMPLGRVVQAGMGSAAAVIESQLAGHSTGAVQPVTEIGAAIWPQAAEILLASSAPPDWSVTGLPPALYPGLVQPIAAVLRRACLLRCLLRDGEVAVLEANQRIISEIVQDLAHEAAPGRIMVAQLILLQSPQAAPSLRRIMMAGREKAETAALHQALTRATDWALLQIESDTGVICEVQNGPLSGIAEQVRRVTALLDDVGRDNGIATHRPQLNAIRKKLDQACRARFAEALTEGLVRPLASASGPLDAADQRDLEACIRDLRALETTVRKIGGGSVYDALLVQALESVRVAERAGTLTPVRKLRLIELLSGPEAAAAAYRQGTH